MKTRSQVLILVLAVLFGTRFAWAWGNATHVYFAHNLGAKAGPWNTNEMYGSLLPDCFIQVFTAEGQFLYGPTHDNAMQMWEAAKTPLEKSLAYGFLTHNQTWGADYTAHITSFLSPSYVYPADPMGGYAREKGIVLTEQLVPVLTQILLDAGLTGTDGEGTPLAVLFAYGIAPELGHDLSETAVDLLVRRNLDPAIGARMLLAAQRRPSNAGNLLADAFAEDLVQFSGWSRKDARAFIKNAEREYQQYIKQYGMAFMLPEPQTIALLAQQSAPVAEMYIEMALAGNGIPGIQVTVQPEQVAEFINLALAAVEPDYESELAQTLDFIRVGIVAHGLHPLHRAFAFDANESTEALSESIGAPATFSLAQNTPNPFNPSTLIGFSVPVQGHVRLAVYNALGQEVATLVDEERPAGSFVARWDAMDQPTGPYFYRIESGSFVETKRMMLVK